MSGSAVAREPQKRAAADDSLASATAEIVTHVARNAASELVKGGKPLREVAQAVAGDAVGELEKHGPRLAKNAGILTWRYAALGWVTWNVGKRIVRRKAKRALEPQTKGEDDDG